MQQKLISAVGSLRHDELQALSVNPGSVLSVTAAVRGKLKIEKLAAIMAVALMAVHNK